MYSLRIDAATWIAAGSNAAKVHRATAYAGLMQYSATLAGAPDVRVTPGNMAAFVRRHPDSPLVRQAINGGRALPVLTVPDDGGHWRWARPDFAATRQWAVPTPTDPDERHAVVTRRAVMTPAALHAWNTACGLTPVGAVATMLDDVPLPPVFTATKRKRRPAPADLESDASDDDGKRQRLSTDDDETGDDLDAMAASDDAVSIGEYDRRDGFIASTSDDDDGAHDGDTSSSSSSSTAPMSLADRHPVPEFDGKCQLYEDGECTLADGTVVPCDHTYVVNGAIGYTSSTTLVGQWLTPFVAEAISLRMAASPNWPDKFEYRGPAEAWAADQLRARHASDGDALCRAYGLPLPCPPAVTLFMRDGISWDTLTGEIAVPPALRDTWQRLCAEHVRSVWTRNATLGTCMHERIEHFYEGRMTRGELEARNEPELGQFLRWHDEWLVPRGFVPFRMELRVFDEAMRVCGSIDALFQHRDTGALIMVDWKRSKEISRTAYGGKTGRGPLAGLPDCNFTKYTMQQNLYRHMLHAHTSLRLTAMYLLICHPRQGLAYDLIPVPERPQEMAALCAARLAAVQHQ